MTKNWELPKYLSDRGDWVYILDSHLHPNWPWMSSSRDFAPVVMQAAKDFWVTVLSYINSTHVVFSIPWETLTAEEVTTRAFTLQRQYNTAFDSGIEGSIYKEEHAVNERMKSLQKRIQTSFVINQLLATDIGNLEWILACIEAAIRYNSLSDKDFLFALSTKIELQNTAQIPENYRETPETWVYYIIVKILNGRERGEKIQEEIGQWKEKHGTFIQLQRQIIEEARKVIAWK